MVIDPILDYARKLAVEHYAPMISRALSQSDMPVRNRLHHALMYIDHMTMRIERIGGTYMPRDEKAKFEFKGFVNIPLDDQAKDAIANSQMDDQALMGDLSSLLLTGYRIGMQWEDYSQAVQVTLTCRDEGSTNYGFAISSRHPDPRTALISVLYKHFEITEGDWSGIRQAPPAPRWD